MRVFLGGTCNGSNWRDEMEKLLQYHNIEYFNPVVDDWTEECYQEELKERATCDICLYTITPKMTGVYAIAEVIDDSNKRPTKTVMVVLLDDSNFHFNARQTKSLDKVGEMVKNNGGQFFLSLKDAAIWIGDNND